MRRLSQLFTQQKLQDGNFREAGKTAVQAMRRSICHVTTMEKERG